MARACELCGRRRMAGNNVSHANNKTKRIFAINLQTVRANINGAGRRIRACTRCIRSGFVLKKVSDPQQRITKEGVFTQLDIVKS